jgi:ABC-type molybdate transport system ATPase subunit
VLFSSHHLDDVERLANYIVVLDYNRLRIAGSVDEVVASVERPVSLADAVLSYMSPGTPSQSPAPRDLVGGGP